MKKNLIFGCFLLVSSLAYSQVGINTTSPQGVLDVVSTTGTFIPPRMTTAQRNLLVAPPTGAVIYNTTTAGLEFNYGTPASPTWKSPVTAASASSNIVLAGGSVDAEAPQKIGAATIPGSTVDGQGYFQFSFNLPASAKCKIDLYPTTWASTNTGVGTRLYIDYVSASSTPVATVVTATTSPDNLHIVVPYSYVTPSNLSAGNHTIRVQAGTTSKIDNNDKITYSYLCWN
ncbi:hypothetical protein [Chryseobacterium sp. 'Rf worker isolate 10']|uniref:hypothetical protein n=1 Tax=Chryseobacterium sp. 'Rf worker isolate 10' TaxID=2887348 RepID=UPI003D6ED2CA